MGFLGRAKSLWGGSSGQSGWSSQDYRVACPEGHILRGTRTDGYQALRCDTCGEAVFILPRSPLPEPPAPADGRQRPQRSQEGFEDEMAGYSHVPPAPSARSAPQPADEAQIEWVDDVEETPEPAQPQVVTAKLIPYDYEPEAPTSEPAPEAPPRPAKPKPAPPASKPAPAAKPAPAPARTVPAGMIEIPDAPTFAERITRKKNLLIFGGVALLVVATVAIRWRKGHLETLPAVVELGRTEGLGKLDLGDFHVAKQILKEAAAAVEALGGRVDGADEIRQGAKEAAIFADRVSERLEVLVEGASKAESESDWTSRFGIYRGQSVIIESTITAVPDPNKPDSKYEIDYEILYGGSLKPAGRGRIDLTGFKLFDLEKPKVGEVKTFGARLESMSFDKSSGAWLIRFAPSSGCFITHAKALESIGWPSQDQEPEESQ